MKRILLLLVVGLMTTAYVGCEKEAAPVAEPAKPAAETPSESGSEDGDTADASSTSTSAMTTVSLKVPNMT